MNIARRRAAYQAHALRALWATMSATRIDHTLTNGRFTLPEGYGVMLESFTPAQKPAKGTRHPRFTSLRSFRSRGRRCPG
jgi:hypothetical protein